MGNQEEEAWGLSFEALDLFIPEPAIKVISSGSSGGSGSGSSPPSGSVASRCG